MTYYVKIDSYVKYVVWHMTSFYFGKTCHEGLPSKSFCLQCCCVVCHKTVLCATLQCCVHLVETVKTEIEPEVEKLQELVSALRTMGDISFKLLN